MNELLQKLLEADVLSEDTKTELETAFQTQLDEAIKAAENNATADVRASLTEQWITERDQIITAIDSKVSDFLKSEMAELKEDIESFRDLEAEYAEKLVEEKASMSDELQTDLSELVEKMDAFLEIRLNAELTELKEDLEEVSKNTFGRKIFEAFADEFMSNYSDDESNAVSLNEATQRLADTETALLESDSQLAELQRITKLDEVLEPLSGHQRDVMAAILGNVATEQLEEGYKTFIGRVLREAEEKDSDDDSEKENKVLADDKDDDEKDDKDTKDKKDSDKKDDKDVKEGRVVTGDTEELLTESNDDPAAAQRIAYLQKIAGINK